MTDQAPWSDSYQPDTPPYRLFEHIDIKPDDAPILLSRSQQEALEVYINEKVRRSNNALLSEIEAELYAAPTIRLTYYDDLTYYYMRFGDITAIITKYKTTEETDEDYPNDTTKPGR